MKFALLSLILLPFVFVVGDDGDNYPAVRPGENKDCKENEEFVDCGRQCDPTCHNPDKDQVCGYICQIGCRCKEPLLRGKNQECLEKEKC
ncbi:allergen Api m 6-like protein [Leptotrombidium deliense]|uniref:Allergen Api m 6-like protein n=1 Tax=Leptotrombidium deliense TaxID=299467 RepID=A0A443SAA7_9ACAR|nr:allergen Api m 6-like protein [Leptotrombidium deliense]